MAATFERQPSVYVQEITIDRPLAPREEPLVYQHRTDDSHFELLTTMMKTSTGDWMYTALDELTLGAPPPSWSQDGWSFTPVDLHLLPNTTLHQSTGKQKNKHHDTERIFSASNVSITTRAIKAELDCQSIVLAGMLPFSSNDTNHFIAEVEDFLDEPPDDINITGYVLPRSIFDGTDYKTTVSNTPRRVVCCANETADSQQAVVAYWSHMNPDLWWGNSTWPGNSWAGLGPLKWPGKIMVKWIVGPAETSRFDIYTNGLPTNHTLMYYTEPPEIQLLSCEPRIIAADARVTVARISGQVLDYSILEEPQPISEPWDAAYEFVGLREEDDVLSSNYSVELRYVTMQARPSCILLVPSHCSAEFLPCLSREYN